LLELLEYIDISIDTEVTLDVNQHLKPTFRTLHIAYKVI